MNDPSLWQQLLPALGVLAGVGCKALFDALREGRLWKREDGLRYVEAKRAAYAEHLAALQELRETHAGMAEVERRRELAAEEIGRLSALGPDEVDQDELRTLGDEVVRLSRRLDEVGVVGDGAYDKAARTDAVISLLAPVDVQREASRAFRATRGDDATFYQAVSAFVVACRRDLGTA